MRPSGRYSVTALHCLFGLAALSFKTCVALGLPTKAADGDGDFVSVAKAHIRTDPQAAARASVAVEADGSLMVRQQEVHPHKTRMDVAPEEDGGRHHGTFDDDGVGKRAVIGADGSLDGQAVDDIPVRREMLRSQEVAEGQLVEDGSAGVSEHGETAAHFLTRNAGAAMTVGVVMLVFGFLILGVMVVLFWEPQLQAYLADRAARHEARTNEPSADNTDRAALQQAESGKIHQTTNEDGAAGGKEESEASAAEF